MLLIRGIRRRAPPRGVARRQIPRILLSRLASGRSAPRCHRIMNGKTRERKGQVTRQKRERPSREADGTIGSSAKAGTDTRDRVEARPERTAAPIPDHRGIIRSPSRRRCAGRNGSREHPAGNIADIPAGARKVNAPAVDTPDGRRAAEPAAGRAPDQAIRGQTPRRDVRDAVGKTGDVERSQR